MILDKNRAGLSVGIFMAIVHAIWALMVAIMPNALQSSLNWIFNVHFLEPIWILTQFNFLDSILLVIATFVIGYVFGWLFALAHNLHHKKK